MTSIWQVSFVLNVPDLDTDSYVHFVIARQIIGAPENLSLHWVWLPLFHYISAGLILSGAKFIFLRFLNIFFVAIIPLILFFFLYKQKNDNSLFIAFVSAELCALFPLSTFMGTTAQPEPLFALLILIFIICVTKEKYILASIILSLSCMLRYEAWAVLVAASVIYVVEIKKNKKYFIDKRILIILLPAAAILGWAILREPFDGKLFGFLFQTQKFASEVLYITKPSGGGVLKILYDIIYYPIIVPSVFAGVNLIFIPFGIKQFSKSNKWFLYSGVGVLVFITLSWIYKSNLGLNRHFVSLIPLYSTLTAYGIVEVSNYFSKRQVKNKILQPSNLKISVLTIIFISSLFYLIMWFSIWQQEAPEGFPQKKIAAEYLGKIEDDKTIFCNDAAIEIISDLDANRFNNIWLENNPDAKNIIIQKANNEGYVYIITSLEKWDKIEFIGEKIYQLPKIEKTNSTIIILKVWGTEYYKDRILQNPNN